MFSLAPLLVVVIGIAGLVFGRQAAQGQIVYQIQGLVGQDGAKAIETMLQNAHEPGAGVVAAVIGVGVLLFGASGVFIELRSSLNTIWDAQSSSGSGVTGVVKERFFSFAMVLAIGFLLLVSLALSAFLAAAGKFLGGLLPLPEALLQAFDFALSFAVTTALFACIYKFVPDAQVGWRDVWIGAAVTALLFTVGKLLIGIYIGKASIGSAYGAAGSIVVLLAWVYYSAQVFFLGAAFTRVYAERYGSLRARKPPQQPAEPRPRAA